jgi:hypothetical protein
MKSPARAEPLCKIPVRNEHAAHHLHQMIEARKARQRQDMPGRNGGPHADAG